MRCEGGSSRTGLQANTAPPHQRVQVCWLALQPAVPAARWPSSRRVACHTSPKEPCPSCPVSCQCCARSPASQPLRRSRSSASCCGPSTGSAEGPGSPATAGSRGTLASFVTRSLLAGSRASRRCVPSKSVAAASCGSRDSVQVCAAWLLSRALLQVLLLMEASPIAALLSVKAALCGSHAREPQNYLLRSFSFNPVQDWICAPVQYFQTRISTCCCPLHEQCKDAVETLTALHTSAHGIARPQLRPMVSPGRMTTWSGAVLCACCSCGSCVMCWCSL